MIGLLLWKKIKTPTVRSFGLIVFVMGFLSAVYHATNNLLTQYFDFFGMALMMSFLLAFVTRRILNTAQKSFDHFFWFYLSFNLTLLLFLGLLKLPVQLLLMLNALPILFAEIYCIFVLKKTRKAKWFALSFVFLIIAQVFAQIDLKRIYCEPQNIFLHGHVIWHCLCAVSMYFAGLHIRENT
jgi:hypothetical protein